MGVTRWRKVAKLAAGAYASGVAGLLLLQVVVGDRTPLLFAINSLSLYWFVPAPLLLAVGVWLRSKPVLAAAGALLLLGAWLWGGLFLPGPDVPDGPRLRVLSYNALGHNFDVYDTVQVVRDSDADVVALQELNLETSAALERELGERYPYRWLEPRQGVHGGGLLSKYPFRRSADQLGGSWVGRTMAIETQLAGRRVTIVRFHAHAGPVHLALRDEQARSLADFARRRTGPLVLLGDLNATDRNDVHGAITEHLRDAWREAGLGFGHTFPGRPTRSEGGARPAILGVPVPRWLVRIDYVFHSADLLAERAALIGSGERSDHRGVAATLVLR